MSGLGQSSFLEMSELRPGAARAGNVQGSFLTMNEVRPGDITPGSVLTSQRQMFGLGQGQGTWLSPSQVPPWERESAARLEASPESFSLRGGLGQAAQGTWLSPSQVPAWERESAARLIRSPESFSLRGLGANDGKGLGFIGILGLGGLVYWLATRKAS